MQITVTIEGVSPYIMHAFNAKAEQAVQNPGRRAHRGEEGTPREQAESVAYRSENGTLFIPGNAIYKAIIEAGKFHKNGRNKLTTNSTSLVPSALWMNSEDALAITLGTKDFEIDSRRFVNPTTRGAGICHRPRLDKWRATFRLDVDDSFFDEKMVRTLVDDAGSKIGIGSMRPEKKGPFGRFKVIKWARE